MFDILKKEYEMPRQGIYRAYLNNQRKYEEDLSDELHQTSKGTFSIRLLIAVFLFSCYFCISTDMKQEIRSYVKPDYSKNVFDFMTNLAYTFDYEKISFK